MTSDDMEIIPAAEAAEVEARLMGASALSLAEREVLVTATLEQSAQMLALVTRATDPARFASAGKAAADMASHYARRLDVSKDLVLDSQVQQRRWERALGVAIRDGQARGVVGTQHDNRHTTSTTTCAVVVEKASPYEYAKRGELYGDGREGGNGVYAMADNVDDADFEEALTGAKAEGNVSRANVVRKIREGRGEHVEPTKTEVKVDAKKAQRQARILGSVINQFAGIEVALDNLLREGLAPALTEDEARSIAGDLGDFARLIGRVKKHLTD